MGGSPAYVAKGSIHDVATRRKPPPPVYPPPTDGTQKNWKITEKERKRTKNSRKTESYRKLQKTRGKNIKSKMGRVRGGKGDDTGGGCYSGRPF